MGKLDDEELIMCQPLDAQTLKFSAQKCGMTFEGIAFVHNSLTPNPLIQIPKPLGISAVKTILKMAEEYKREKLAREAILLSSKERYLYSLEKNNRISAGFCTENGQMYIEIKPSSVEQGEKIWEMIENILKLLQEIDNQLIAEAEKEKKL